MGRSTLYPNIDFCKYPESTCANAQSEQLRWTTALFEWAERVQRYEALPSSTEDDPWNFEDRLVRFVDDGLEDDSFIVGVSRILSHECHNSGCSELTVRMLERRKAHFFMIVNDVFDIKTLLNPPAPTSAPTRRLTQQPSSNAPTAGLPAGPQPQIITMRPVTPNPTLEAQQPNSPSPVSPPEQNPLPTFFPTNDELIGLEGNVASRVDSKEIFQIILGVAIALYRIIIFI